MRVHRWYPPHANYRPYLITLGLLQSQVSVHVVPDALFDSSWPSFFLYIFWPKNHTFSAFYQMWAIYEFPFLCMCLYSIAWSSDISIWPFFLFSFSFGVYTLPSHASAEACLTGWPNAQPQGRDQCSVARHHEANLIVCVLCSCCATCPYLERCVDLVPWYLPCSAYNHYFSGG